VSRTIMSNQFAVQWAEALGIDPMEVSRVVIDAQVGSVLKVYVEKFGTDRLLQVKPPDPSSVDVRVID